MILALFTAKITADATKEIFGSLYWGRIFVLAFWIFSLSVPVGAEGDIPSPAVEAESSLRIAVVGDTGIGERAFHSGFLAVMKAVVSQRPDVLLHLGDFVYQPDFMPASCDPKYIGEIRKMLVAPFRFRLFVPGDNDLPPHLKKPMASGCWDLIDPLDSGFDPVTGPGPRPRRFEGTRTIGGVMFVVLNSHPWADPTAWLKPRIEDARARGLWVIAAMHEPPVTTAWFLDKRDTVLKQIDALKPDLVFSGNQHSYERFHALGVPGADGRVPFVRPRGSVYQKGSGTIHVVSGGGGATLKPFADLAGKKKRTAPSTVFDALAKRALINHFVLLEIGRDSLRATTYRVCARAGKNEDPRWRPGKPVWKTIRLECGGQPPGVTVFDHFEIHRAE